MTLMPTDVCRSDMERFGLTTCAVCNDLMHQSEAVIATFYQGRGQLQEHMCGDDCRDKWLEDMRKAGL